MPIYSEWSEQETGSGNLFGLASAYPNTANQVSNPSDIPSGYGAMYDNLFKANPYRDLTYHQSGWDKLKSTFGFRSGYDDFLEQQQQNIAQYDAGIFSMMAQNQYNSDAAKAQRMREAGLNPDLLGTGDASDSAVPTEDPEGMTPQGAAEGARIIGGFARGLMAAFSAAFDSVGKAVSIGAGIAGIKGQRLENQGMEIANEGAQIANDSSRLALTGSLEDRVKAYFISRAQSYALAYPDDKNDDMWAVIARETLNTRNPTASYFGLDSSYDGQISSISDDFRHSLETEGALMRMVKEYQDNYKSVNETVSSGLGFQSDANDPVTEAQGIVVRELADMSRQIMKAQAQNELSSTAVEAQDIENQGLEAQITGEQLHVLQQDHYGEKEANRMSAESTSKFWENTYSGIVASVKSHMMEKLSEAADRGNGFCSALLWQMTMNDFLNFEISGGVDFNLFKGITKFAEQIFSPKGQTLSNSSSPFSKSGFGFDVNFKVSGK